MKPSRIVLLVSAFALVCAGSASGQEIVKPVEESGNTASSDQPLPKKKSVVLPRRVGKVDVSEAARRLEQAQLARKQGLEPRPGEFVKVGSVKQVNYRYWQRQEKLRHAVELAQRRSQTTASRYGGPLKVSQI